MVTINLVGSDKGRTGKSTFAAILAEYYETRKESIKCIDADPTNPTLSKWYPDVSTIILNDDPDMIEQLHLAFVVAKEEQKNVIVDLPSRSEKALHNWEKTFGIESLAKKHNIKVIKWWVAAADPEVITPFNHSKDSNHDYLHILVQNEGLSNNHQWETFNRKLNDPNVETLRLKKLMPLVVTFIRDQESSYKDATQENSGLDILSRSSLETWRKTMFESLDKVSCFASKKSKAPAKS